MLLCNFRDLANLKILKFSFHFVLGLTETLALVLGGKFLVLSLR